MKAIQPIEATMDQVLSNVFSNERNIETPDFPLPKGMRFNSRMKMDGLNFLKKLDEDCVPVAVFDPQYRGVLDKLDYGNEGKQRGKERCNLLQMNEETITKFVNEISRVLIPSGHLFLWMDKFHLCTGFLDWMNGTSLEVVDMIVWHKNRMGMGYRTRRVSEYAIILQKTPRRAKGVWKIHNIPDVWMEEIKKQHTHQKPVDLQGELIAAVSHTNDVVIDPAAGSFSVMEACRVRNRNFLGCDING